MKNRPEITADAYNNGRGSENVLHVFSESGDITTPGSHGGSREGISPAGMRQCRRHFRDGEAEPRIHRRHDDERDEHARKSAGDESKIPAEEIAGDDRGHAKRP